jgi:excisionase family DNA binding protein
VRGSQRASSTQSQRKPAVQAADGRNDSHTAPKAGALLTAQQLAELMSVPVSQIWRLSRRGALPVVHVGRYYRYRLDEVELWQRNGGSIQL